MRSAFQWFKRQDSVGATPRGQSRPGRPAERRWTPFFTFEAAFDQDAVQGGYGGPLTTRSNWERVLAVQDATGTRRLSSSKGHGRTL